MQVKYVASCLKSRSKNGNKSQFHKMLLSFQFFLYYVWLSQRKYLISYTFQVMETGTETSIYLVGPPWFFQRHMQYFKTKKHMTYRVFFTSHSFDISSTYTCLRFLIQVVTRKLAQPHFVVLKSMLLNYEYNLLLSATNTVK